jgi:hypothetical protein
MKHPILRYIEADPSKRDVKQVAQMVSCRPVTIYRIIAGTRYPSRGLAARLELKTKGEISAPEILSWNIAKKSTRPSHKMQADATC